ncbi:MAG: hypothetical protein L3J53_07000 [Proteobacteria bacterium]|nr:hypothetical protein [Pseudomonadota bacterium]
MSKERDILKSLLLKEELEVLATLKSKLLSDEQFTQEVANVLTQAIQRANKQDKKFSNALYPPIKAGVMRAFATSKQSIIDALLPIMGQLIRKTVAHNIKQFITDINRAIEQSWSLKWRWQAYKAGITYPEMVFKKTIHYQVRELFLISRKNGLLIEHVGANNSLKDNDAMSAMLTVIQDFISDSFQQDDANLQSVVIKNNEYIITSGPKAYLASVVKGIPTERLKERTQELIENIHADFSESLTQEELYRHNVDLNAYLVKHLITKNKDSQNTNINWKPWIIAIILIFASLFYRGYQNYQKQVTYNNLVTVAENIDGFYLQAITKTSKGLLIKGLKDPLADIYELQGSNITIKTKPYISLDEAIIKLRIDRVISKYPNINAKFDGSNITLTGTITPANRSKILYKTNKILGIDEVFDKLILDKEPEIEKKLPQHQSRISTKLLIAAINQTTINMPKFKLGEENDKLKKIHKNLHLLMQQESRMNVIITGASDCNGILSDSFSQQRADKLKQNLLQNNIDKFVIKTKIKPCTNYNQNKNESLLNVSFKAQQVLPTSQYRNAN